MSRTAHALPGIGGTLLPTEFLLDGMSSQWSSPPVPEGRARQLRAWWHSIELSCGPATGMRTLLDRAARPLFRMLGFRLIDLEIGDAEGRLTLGAPDDITVAAIVRPWASRPPLAWRDVVDASMSVGAEWCFLLAPPYLALVDARGHAVRRCLDFAFPAALEPPSVGRFWHLASSTAFARTPATDAAASRLAGLVAASQSFHVEVTRDLQRGVVDALSSIATVLPARGGRPHARGRAEIVMDEALTVIYRVLFLLFAESRQLVPAGNPVYGASYSITTLCREAITSPADDHRGVWEALAAITRLSRIGCRTADLIVRPFNGRLFARLAAPSLEAPARRRASVARSERDAALRQALVALGSRPGPAGRQTIRYADLGVEQLGAVYERVLDLDPASVLTSRSVAASHSRRRKESGTFYTPQPLADFVVRRTLAPLVKHASADRILSLRVVDPSMGSGAFLVSACRYLTRAYAQALIEEGRATAADLDDAQQAALRRLVAERCLAGVDINPVAVQLARLSLWLTSLSAGKPLGFLDHRLRTGHSLVGAGPADLRRVPRRRRRSDLPLPLFDGDDVRDAVERSADALTDLALRRDDDVRDVRAKEAAWRRLTGPDSPLAPWRAAASVWCAPWFEEATEAMSPSEVRAMLDALLRGDRTIGESRRRHWLGRTQALADRHRFFHWPLEFADVFFGVDGVVRPSAGFDAVIGNPPWEMLRRDPASDRSSGASADGDGQRLLRFVRESGLYPSCDRGHLNLYQAFVDRSIDLLRPGGRLGLVVPWGLASDDGAARLRTRLMDHLSIDTMVGFDNAQGMFPIHRGVRFMALVAGGERRPDIAARFGVKTDAELDHLPELETASAQPAYPIRLTPHLLKKLGGAMRRIPDVRHSRHLDLLRHLMESQPRLADADGWSARFGRELNATDDRMHLGDDGLPVIEGKHLAPFVVDIASAKFRIRPATADRLLRDRRYYRARVGYRDVSAVGNRVTLIAALIPAGAVTTHTIFCLRTRIANRQQHFLIGILNSFVVNLAARMLMGSHLTTSLIESLPVPRWNGSAAHRRIAGLARQMSCVPAAGRLRVHARVQAAVANLYQLDDSLLESVLDASPLADEETRAAVLAEWTFLRRGE